MRFVAVASVRRRGRRRRPRRRLLGAVRSWAAPSSACRWQPGAEARLLGSTPPLCEATGFESDARPKKLRTRVSEPAVRVFTVVEANVLKYAGPICMF